MTPPTDYAPTCDHNNAHYGVRCQRAPGHTGDHESTTPFADPFVRWRNGPWVEPVAETPAPPTFDGAICAADWGLTPDDATITFRVSRDVFNTGCVSIGASVQFTFVRALTPEEPTR